VLFVDRRELAESGDGGGDEFERGVDVGVSVLASEREAQAGAERASGSPMALRTWEAQWTGGASRSAGDREAFEVEGDDERFAFQVVEVQVGGVGNARLAGAVDAALFDL